MHDNTGYSGYPYLVFKGYLPTDFIGHLLRGLTFWLAKCGHMVCNTECKLVDGCTPSSPFDYFLLWPAFGCERKMLSFQMGANTEHI